MSGALRCRAGRLLTAGAALAAIAGSLSACSSSKSAAAGPTGDAGTSPAASGSAPSAASSGASSGLSAAEKLVAQAEQFPNKIPLTTPVRSAPPKGKTFVVLQCEISQCTDIADGAKAATAAIGWNLKVIPYQSANPATMVSALQQALQYNPVAVGFSGLPEAVWQSVLPAYQKAGVPLIPAFMGPLTTPSPQIPYDLSAKVGVLESANQLAAWVDVDSKGTGKVLVVNVPSFPILAEFGNAFEADVKSQCSGCTVSSIDATIPEVDAGQIDSLVVSALQKDPSIDYVSTVDGAFIDGLPSALAAAGLTGKVKVVGVGADVANEANILAGGPDTAFFSLATVYSGWLMVDAAIREVEGMPVVDPEDGGLPSQLLTKKSMTESHIQPANSYNYPTDYPQQFKALWHVG